MSGLDASASHPERPYFFVGMTFGWELDWAAAVCRAVSFARASRVRYCVRRLPGEIWVYRPVRATHEHGETQA